MIDVKQCKTFRNRTRGSAVEPCLIGFSRLSTAGSPTCSPGRGKRNFVATGARVTQPVGLPGSDGGHVSNSLFFRGKGACLDVGRSNVCGRV